MVLVAAAAVAEAEATGLALTVVLCVVMAACTLPARFPPSRSLRDPRLLAVCTVLPPAAGSDRRGRPSADDHRRRDEHGGGLPMDCGRFDGAGITADVVVATVADTPLPYSKTILLRFKGVQHIYIIINGQASILMPFQYSMFAWVCGIGYVRVLRRSPDGAHARGRRHHLRQRSVLMAPRDESRHSYRCRRNGAPRREGGAGRGGAPA